MGVGYRKGRIPTALCGAGVPSQPPVTVHLCLHLGVQVHLNHPPMSIRMSYGLFIDNKCKHIQTVLAKKNEMEKMFIKVHAVVSSYSFP